MDNLAMKNVHYQTLHNDLSSPININNDCEETGNNMDIDPEDATKVIYHKVPKYNGKLGFWTHIDNLDFFFQRMYKYYVNGGFYPTLLTNILNLMQFIYIIWFLTFLTYSINYPKLFRNDSSTKITDKLTIADVIYPLNESMERISWTWWCLIILCGFIWFIKLIRAIRTIYISYDIKLFYNHILQIDDSDLTWINWGTVQRKVQEAQYEERMCVHKPDINELDMYHRILRYDNYMVAMVNKNILPLNIYIPFIGDYPYLSGGLKLNLKLLLFHWPFNPWESSWKLTASYRDIGNRSELAKQLEHRILYMAIFNIVLSPIILTWQIMYTFLHYAEVLRRAPSTLGVRMWSPYARVALRHFNELDHELQERLSRAYKPATKYLASFPSPCMSVIAKNVAFLCGSMCGVLVVLSVYDEDVLTVEHVLSIITLLGIVLAGTRLFTTEEDGRYMTGAAVGEELLVQVLGHVQYLPADWRGRAHTKAVAQHFQKLFQYRATNLILEILSPIICPFILLRLRWRALDIVDFYRNFTVSVMDIGDVCSFAQLNVRRHGNPEWQNPRIIANNPEEEISTQYEQGEMGKTELSLLAFSCHNPPWKPKDEQMLFLDNLRQSTNAATASMNPLAHNFTKTMLGSYIQKSMYGDSAPSSAVMSYNRQKDLFKLPNMDDTSDEEEEPSALPGGSAGAGSCGPRARAAETLIDMSHGALHLYDIHLSLVQKNQQLMSMRIEPCCARNCDQRPPPDALSEVIVSEATPLLSKT